jgi:hypothetical protein
MRFGVLLIAVLVTQCCIAQVVLVPRGSTWKYYYNGVLPTNWVQKDFDDRSWPSGPAQIGWGEGDERTVAIDDPGFDPTLYFRKSFVVTNSTFQTATVRLVADDGAVVYLNGMEILRRNMPRGAVDFFTLANVNVVSNENAFVQYGIPSYYLRPGTNTIAVELHQHAAGGEDASFDLELIANIPPTPPEVKILHPVDGSVVPAGNNLFIEATASDADGNVQEVILYFDGVAVNSFPDSFAFTWENPPPGRHTIMATAVDNLSILGDSPLVHVQVGDVSEPIQLVRGPYLQLGTATSIVVRWRTDWLTDSILYYGTNSAAPEHVVTYSAKTNEHLVGLNGLNEDTLYYYWVGSSEGVLANGPECHFRTAPTNDRPVRIWVIGDSGTADAHARAVRDAFLQRFGDKPADVWLMLGDNAYNLGQEDEYQRAVFDTYTYSLRNIVLWPALGNHDAGGETFGNPGPYLRAFTFAEAGEAGGTSSGTPLYYSFDCGNIHFICLDSFLSDRSTNGAMLTWLRSDLAMTEKDWIIGYWHHPPYSWGSHVSDTDDREMFEMRTRVLPILEDYGVDLVLTGHSHVYERSFLLNGHYGYSWELQPEMILDRSLGRTNDTGPYQKPAGGIGSRKGTVYAVCGCSGEGGWGGFGLHPAMATNYGGFGSMVLDVNGQRLDARFVRETGEIQDYFSIDKSAPPTNGPALKIARTNNGQVLRWPTSKPPFSAEGTARLDSAEWETVTDAVTTIGREKRLILEGLRTNRFFRLKREL